LAAVGARLLGARRIGFLWNLDPNDPVGKSWVAALMQGLAGLGWVEGRSLRVDVRWDPRTPEQTRTFGQELIALHPDVLVTGTPRLTLALQQMTKTIPIVFVGAGDPLAQGIITSAAHPGGNTTGVTDLLPGLGSKWLELLKECMPSLSRVALIHNADLANPNPGANRSAISAAEAGAQYGVMVSETLVRNPDEIERAISAFAATSGGGLIVLPPPLPGPDRKLVNGLAIRHGLPVLYQDRSFAVDGGLLAYGTDMIYMFGHDAPPYIDRILRGEKPGDLPVQYPTKFILTVNLTTAKAMGLKIPESFLLRAAELVE
jgi:putative ABC transport system substrate-binding protein